MTPFKEEIVLFDKVRPAVTFSYYIGLTGKTDTIYHLATYPCLATGALWHYERSLVTEEERKNFASYKVQEISNHIKGFETRSRVKTLVNGMAQPEVSIIVNTIRVMDFGAAEKVMATKTAEERKMYLKVLRSHPAPGPWAETMIANENKRLSDELTQMGVGLLEKELDSKKRKYQSIVDDKVDATSRQEAKAKLYAWEQSVRDRIDILRPWDTDLNVFVAQHRTAGLEATKNSILELRNFINANVDL